MRMRFQTPEIFSLFLIFPRSVAFTSLICGASCLSLSLPKVNLLFWSGKWSAQQDKNLGRFPNSGAEFYYSNTCKELRCLTALYVPVKLHDSSNFILQSWKLRKYVSFSVLLFFCLFVFCCEGHSLLWEQLIFIILTVADGETNILGYFTKTVVRKESYSVEQENNLWIFLQQLLHIFKLPIRHSTNISFQMHATY